MDVSTKRLRQSVGTKTQDPDSLSMDVIPTHDLFQPILDELETCNAFSKDQILAVGDTLRSLDISPKNNGISPLVLFQGQRVSSFTVQAPLGRGGEGTIYRGSDEHGNTAAIKILHNMRVSHHFRREMQMVRDLAHRNIVTAYEVGEFQGWPFIAIELLEGRDHNPNAFTTWFAGGGIKGGVSYGETDEIGLNAVVDKVSIHDLHATILHLLGIDYE